MSDEIKRMDIKEFREFGYLQELNRIFLHPLGLALEVKVDPETGEESFGGVWDSREDPEGIMYEAPYGLDPEKRDRVFNERTLRAPVRMELFNGGTVQPCEEKP